MEYVKMVDTHVHIWNLEKARYTWLDHESATLNQNHLIEEWSKTAADEIITTGVLVQAANNLEDTQVMLDAMDECDRIEGVVGWLPLFEPMQVEKLLQTRFLNDNRLKGIRHLIHDEADPQWLLQPQVIESLQILASHNLTFDIVGVTPQHIVTAIKVAEQVPNLKMVFDHLNQPPIASGEKFGKWGTLMKEAAQYSGLHAKISGLGYPAGKPFNWTNQDIEPYILFVLEQFGTNRCFCGSDWPVCLLNGSYEHTVQQYIKALKNLLTPVELTQVMEANAINFYHLKPNNKNQ